MCLILNLLEEIRDFHDARFAVAAERQDMLFVAGDKVIAVCFGGAFEGCGYRPGRP